MTFLVIIGYDQPSASSAYSHGTFKTLEHMGLEWHSRKLCMHIDGWFYHQMYMCIKCVLTGPINNSMQRFLAD